MKIAMFVGAILLLVLPLFSQTNTPGNIGSPQGRLVDVGGRKLHLYCTGAGSPTVILEAGASSFAIDWSLVQPEIARTNRVCSYDRAGFGWSDAGGPVETGVVSDLQSLLQTAGEKPPYVLVGASRGGLYVRLFQLGYPHQVLGMVLVDPAQEDRLYTMFQGSLVLIATLNAEQFRSVFPRQSATVPRRQPQTGTPFDRLPRALYETRIELDRRLIASVPETVPYEAIVNRAEGERTILAALRESRSKSSSPLGNLPLVVLTRGIGSSQELRDAHAGLARISTNSRHTVVTGAGHEVHLFEPNAVIEAVQDVITASKSKAQLPKR